MEKKLPGVIAGLVVALAIAAPAGAATVTVRVEGATGTLVPRALVNTTTAPVGKPGAPTCSGTSALGALDKATGGDWNGTYDSGFGDYLIDTVRGERSYDAFPADPAHYWSLWINYKGAQVGACQSELQTGDEVLLFADCYSGASPCSLTPLRLSGVPATAAPGQAVTVRVDEVTFDGVATPAAGVTVSAGGQRATTGTDGSVPLALSGQGPLTVVAAKPGFVRDEGATCLTSGSDGACGSATAPSAGPGATGTPAAGRDTTAPRPAFTGLRMGRRYAHGKGPRLLAGTVAQDPSGLGAVKLSLTRERGGKTWYFSGRSERFRRQPRGRSVFFGLGDRGQWSYLLPRRLGPGRYTIQVAAIDKAGNRAEAKVVIRVR
jgi:hypothetical protein